MAPLREGVVAWLTGRVAVVFLGESGVGKTCLATRFEKGTFVTNSASTIGAAFSTTTLELGGALVKIQMWDTAGQVRRPAFFFLLFRLHSAEAICAPQERYHCLAPMYYREAAGAFVVYVPARVHCGGG